MTENLGLILLAAALASPCQTPSLRPAPARVTLVRIARILARYPASPETAEQIAGIRKSATWLAARLDDAKTPDPYGRDLEKTLSLLDAAALEDTAIQSAALKSAYADLILKHADCKRFGMARLVKVRVKTIESGKESGGWQVFYTWLPGRPVGTVRPQPFPALSSPTEVHLPPGAYSLRAVKDVQGKPVSSRELSVPVGGEKSVEFEIPVP